MEIIVNKDTKSITYRLPFILSRDMYTKIYYNNVEYIIDCDNRCFYNSELIYISYEYSEKKFVIQKKCNIIKCIYNIDEFSGINIYPNKSLYIYLIYIKYYYQKYEKKTYESGSLVPFCRYKYIHTYYKNINDINNIKLFNGFEKHKILHYII